MNKKWTAIFEKKKKLWKLTCQLLIILEDTICFSGDGTRDDSYHTRGV